MGIKELSGGIEEGRRVRIPEHDSILTVDSVQNTGSGLRLYLLAPDGNLIKYEMSHAAAAAIEVIREDGRAPAAEVMAGLWTLWMRAATVDARTGALSTTPLRPYAHQQTAVYGAMLPQPRLRFLLADEPGTGKTIMAGLYIREMQRLGFVRRALIVVPAHLVSKWQADFDRFFGGGLRRITSSTVHERALQIDQDLWVVSLDLAAVNPNVLEAIRPDRAGWDVVVFDEAHRLTPTAEAYHRVGTLLSAAPRLLLMTATPHRGKEWLFRALLHTLDPEVFPPGDQAVESTRRLRPGPVHFLRRMKEELLDYDGITKLFKARRASNVSVPLNAVESAFYRDALALVDEYFPPSARTLAKMVYGKRGASSLYALAETLRRRREQMGTESPVSAAAEVDPEDEDQPAQDEARVTHEASLDERGERQAVGALLAQLEPLVADPDLKVSKWPRILNDCLAVNGIAPGLSEQAVVFTEYADTADWLLKRFRSAGFTAERYSGRDHHLVRDLVRTRFADRRFQILVSTDAGNEGIDLQTAHVLVNWDIPWSLVRLEQRMGRIHRVGQTRDVELFNLIATDTREGEVLEVLLNNFVIAANQLNGKLFDSLSLVADLLEIDPEKTLVNCFTDPRAAREAREAVGRISADRIASTAQQVAREENALASKVDLAAAVATLQDATLERINPTVVGAYLERIGRAQILAIRPAAAGDDLFLAEAASGNPLPEELGKRNPALLAVSGRAIDDAIAVGSDVEGAVILGPGSDAFRALTSLVASTTAASVWRGTTLRDPSSVTDYVLVAYEAPIEEFGGRRSTVWPFVIRVDDSGARRVRWEVLANLESAEHGDVSLHPAVSSSADDAATVVISLEEERRRRILADWVARAETELEKLPERLVGDIADPTARKEARSRASSAVEARVADLRQMGSVNIGAPLRLGWTRVVGAGDAAVERGDSEIRAMKHVTELLVSEGWKVADVHLEGRGYDVHARRRSEQRCVEVKGVGGVAATTGVRLTGNEILMARQLGDDYWLYVVDQCDDGPGRLFGIYRDPAVLFSGLMKDVAIIQLPGSALTSKRAGA